MHLKVELNWIGEAVVKTKKRNNLIKKKHFAHY